MVVEQDAGAAAGFPDAAYVRPARTSARDADLFSTADIVLQVRSVPPETGAAAPGQMVIGFADPLGAPEAIRALAQTRRHARSRWS